MRGVFQGGRRHGIGLVRVTVGTFLRLALHVPAGPECEVCRMMAGFTVFAGVFLMLQMVPFFGQARYARVVAGKTGGLSSLGQIPLLMRTDKTRITRRAVAGRAGHDRGLCPVRHVRRRNSQIVVTVRAGNGASAR